VLFCDACSPTYFARFTGIEKGKDIFELFSIYDANGTTPELLQH